MKARKLAVRTTLLALLIVLAHAAAGCWLPPAFSDIWADNQSGSSVVVTLTYGADPVTYAFAVPATSRGIVLQGFAVPSGIVVTDAGGAILGSFETSNDKVGVLIDATGVITIREGQAIPFADAVEFERVNE